MKVSYNWLKEYAAVDASPDELGEILTMGGLEVEGIEQIGSLMEGIVVGEVLDVRPHPNADRLVLCDVDLGGGQHVQIACGAPNVAAGQKVPVATVGSTLMLPGREDPNEREAVTIRKAKIRGEISEGMICSEGEIGLSEDHSGIMVLREDAEAGQPFLAFLRAEGIEPADAVLDVSITPNRPDAASHIGVARDAAALTGTRLTIPPISLPDGVGDAGGHVSVDIQSPDGCPRYVAMLVRGVVVRESPAWLKARLTAIGLRPRNNVVDVTNFVLHEVGQPLHAFDFDEIAGATIRVHRTNGETEFTTLDGKERMLPAGTLMIADAERDVAVAGVMGGENSEVNDATRNVLIESAYFDPSSIRKTAKALGVQTDASYRFERGVDRDGQIWAAARAAALIAELGGGTIVAGMVDAQPVSFEPRQIRVRPSRVDALLGMNVSPEDSKRLLESIGFEVELEDRFRSAVRGAVDRVRSGSDGSVAEGRELLCIVPTYRPDVEREVDVIEEIARLFGYGNIPEPEHSKGPSRNPWELPEDRLRRSARALLSSNGYREIFTNSMQGADLARQFNQEVLARENTDAGVVVTLNPISQEMAALRPSLLPGALEVMSFNRKHGQRVLRFYEFGHVFRRSDRRDTIVDGYAEREVFILTASGIAVEAGWDTAEREVDVFDLKGMVGMLLDSLRLPDVTMRPVYRATSVTRHHLDVYVGDTRIGLVAEVSEAVAAQFDLRQPVYFAELDFATIVSLAAPHMERRYRPVSRYPIVERDLAVVVSQSQDVGALLDTIQRSGGKLLRDVGVFDLYEGKNLGQGRKSVAFSLRFGADRTLTDEEVDAAISGVVEELQSEFDAEFRT